MKELDLANIKQIEYRILVHFNEFAKQNGIRYFLSNGTLLGAIKYRGFIPWDDDIDIFVPREDYTRLIKTYRDDESYKLFSYERNKDFCYPFAKLCDMSTRKMEKHISNGVELGLDIDIFPLDDWSDTFRDARRDVKKVQILMRKMNFSKMPYKRGKNILRTIPKMCVLIWTKIWGTKSYIRRIHRLAEINSNIGDNKYKGCVVWPIYGEKEIIPAEVFRETIQVEFEGEKFPAPIGYDIYLRSLYGDYKKDPPLEEQRTHHGFVAYRI